MQPDERIFRPSFDLGEFRYAVARYVKLLIRARWKQNPGFISPERLRAWGLEDISADRLSAASLLEQAAGALAHLNCTYLPRCGSGGVKATEDTPVGRLIFSISFFAEYFGGGPEHNGSLLTAESETRAGSTLDWDALVQWDWLDDIRYDLDLLPAPAGPELQTRLDAIESKLALIVVHQPHKDWYTTEELAAKVGKAEFTVRAWCREGRVRAMKQNSGRGAHSGWVVSHEELLRYERDGLLPAEGAKG